MNIPPFTITDNIVNLVAEINNKLGKLEANLDKKKNLYLRKASKIKSVNSSCAIEANTLTEKEVEGILNGKKIIAPPNEIIEVQNAFNAYSNISNFKPYEIKSFLKAHKYLTENLVKECGKFRSGDAGVFENDVAIHYGARPQFVHGLIQDLFNWAKESNLNPLIKSSVIHYEIETIHPFSDGNGRIGRLWQSIVLYNYNKLFELIPIETLIYENQQTYYDKIEESRKNDNSTPFIEFMLDMISKTIDTFESNSKTYKIKQNCLQGLNKSEKEILNIILYLDLDDYITVEAVNEKANKSISSIRNYFKKFTSKNIFIGIGENKGRKYKLNKDILE
ncbi:MAG: Fic family protein [Lachnospiraceae bacterium]|jgi:Fic family protein|nr:Fic family protein [Lachnospiraceae bacterium]